MKKYWGAVEMVTPVPEPLVRSISTSPVCGSKDSVPNEARLM